MFTEIISAIAGHVKRTSISMFQQKGHRVALGRAADHESHTFFVVRSRKRKGGEEGSRWRDRDDRDAADAAMRSLVTGMTRAI